MPARDAGEMIRGRTIRFIWTDGPTKGSTHEHVFHADGTVEWHSVPQAASSAAAGKRSETNDRPRYSSVAVTEDIWLVSYLASSGYTLTVMLNFADASLVGIASNDKNWFPVRGHFEVAR